MKHHKVAWGLIIGGGIYEALVAISTADAQTSGVTVDQTAFGKLYTPIEKVNPFSVDVGSILLLAGGFILAAAWVEGKV